jgi:hypothetical protein
MLHGEASAKRGVPPCSLHGAYKTVTFTILAPSRGCGVIKEAQDYREQETAEGSRMVGAKRPLRRNGRRSITVALRR